jgi:hypothetical protein
VKRSNNEKFKNPYTVKEWAKQFLTFGDNLITKPLRSCQVPILDPLYRSGKEYIDINYRGKTKEKLEKALQMIMQK